jgi:hypothetical protein
MSPAEQQGARGAQFESHCLTVTFHYIIKLKGMCLLNNLYKYLIFKFESFVLKLVLSMHTSELFPL